jgi:hypothetical protein
VKVILNVILFIAGNFFIIHIIHENQDNFFGKLVGFLYVVGVFLFLGFAAKGRSGGDNGGRDGTNL